MAPSLTTAPAVPSAQVVSPTPARPSSPPPLLAPAIALTSVAGGAGKSVLAVALAAAGAKAGLRSCLVQLDQHSSARRYLDLDVPFGAAALDRLPIGEPGTLPHDRAFSFCALPAPPPELQSVAMDLNPPQAFARAIQILRASYDLVVLDPPHQVWGTELDPYHHVALEEATKVCHIAHPARLAESLAHLRDLTGTGRSIYPTLLHESDISVVLRTHDILPAKGIGPGSPLSAHFLEIPDFPCGIWQVPRGLSPSKPRRDIHLVLERVCSVLESLCPHLAPRTAGPQEPPPHRPWFKSHRHRL